MRFGSNFLILVVFDSRDASVENCNADENVEEVREDNLDAARKQQLSKTKKNKQLQALDNSHLNDQCFSTGQWISDLNMWTRAKATYAKTRAIRSVSRLSCPMRIHNVLPRVNSFVPRTESVLHTEQFSDVDNRPHFEHVLDSERLGRVLKLLEIFNTEL